MNILFFTPVVNTSAIGRMAALVVNEMLLSCNTITVVRTESPSRQETATHQFNAPVIGWNELESELAAMPPVDLCIYHIGNYFDFHEGAIHWLKKLPGIICLHDFFLGHLFSGWAAHNPEEAHATLKAWYGITQDHGYFRHTDANSFIEQTRDSAPMTEWLCSLATGVVTHSSWGGTRVLNSCPGPVQVLPLCYDAPGQDFAPNAPDQNTDKSLSFQLLTIGHANSNKRIEQVIEAIASDLQFQHDIDYQLVGHIEPAYKTYLQKLAHKVNVRLSVAGEVDSATLAKRIVQSDMVSCLRWPALEAASASAIEAMLYGKAIMCMDTGFYADIPDQYIYKINIENEKKDIVMHLKNALNNRESVIQLGKKAKVWAYETFSPRNYAQGLFDFSGQVLKAQPKLQACKALLELTAGWSSRPQLVLRKEDLQALAIFS